MALSRPFYGLFKFMIPAFVILCTTYYLYNSHQPVKVQEYMHFDESVLPPVTDAAKEDFIQDFLDYEIDGPYNGTALAKMCASPERKYKDDVIVYCDPSPGGMGNVRNMFLDCIRFAIEGGATAIIVPEIQLRGTDELIHLFTGHNAPFEYFFDLPHFEWAWRKDCPQIHLYSNLTEVHNIFPHFDPKNLTLWDSYTMIHTHHPIAITIIEGVDKWRPAFDLWLEETAPPHSKEKPLVLLVPQQLLRFPFTYDPPEFVATFGRILKSRDEVKRLAGAALYRLSEKFALNLNMRGPIQPHKFFGAHLRTASDAITVGWPGYEMQAPNYLAAAASFNLNLIFLSGGNPVDVERFKHTAKVEHGITVVTKDDLLDKKETRALEQMSWDHRGMIDFEILLHCSQFGGMYESSFSWNVANRRHVVVHEGTWGPINAETQGVKEEEGRPECFIDKLSRVFGPYSIGGVRWQFPLGLYP